MWPYAHVKGLWGADYTSLGRPSCLRRRYHASSVGGYAGRKEKGYALASKVARQVGNVRRRVIATLDHVEELRFR